MSKKKVAKTKKITHLPLPDPVDSNGCQHTLIKREGDVGVFKKEQTEKPWRNYCFMGYETVIIKRHDGYKLGTSWIEPAEVYPGSSLWGIFGWSYQTEYEAFEKFYELVEKVKTGIGYIPPNEED